MKHRLSARDLTLPRLCLVVSAIAFGLPATAQQPAEKPVQESNAQSASEAMDDIAPAAEHATMEEEPLRVGDATQDLLSWQRSGVIASKTPRPIAGPIAYRSYERYLKSFEYQIPERFNSTVKAKTGN
ncbi:DUF3613 domain-containing protein [Variovorax sp. LT1R20]|uniref:DUF3613 domain-containing protein n=1 Tax=Variovorax sp. LT1R20 TaxID=3443729 RepID=UPI003F4519ED